MSHNKLSHNVFIKKLSDQNISYAEGYFKVLSKYKGGDKKILVKTKYGLCKVRANHLLKGSRPTIQSATNKTDYIKSMFVEKWENLFCYNKVNYINARTKVKIECLKHGFFLVTPDNHLTKKSGCPKCKIDFISTINTENPTGWSYTDWKTQGNNSKYFDSFKVYIIKFWNDEEQFYKIGKTFTTVKRRFNKNLPYKYEVVKYYKGEAKEISELEKQLQKENRDNKYIPKLKFGGMYECFSSVKLTNETKSNYETQKS